MAYPSPRAKALALLVSVEKGSASLPSESWVRIKWVDLLPKWSWRDRASYLSSHVWLQREARWAPPLVTFREPKKTQTISP